MLILAIAFAAAQDPLPVLEGLEYGPETTVLTEPRRADGSIDYFKALNDRYGEGVTPENNAAVEILLTMGDARLVGESARWYEDALMQLGVELPQERATFIRWDDYPGFADSAQERDARDDVVSSPWSVELYPTVAQWLRDNQDAMDAVEEASLKPRFFVPLASDPDDSDPMLLDALLLHAGHARELADAFAARANARIRDGQIASAWSDVMVVKRLSRLVAQEPMIVSSVIANRINALSSVIIREIASSEEFEAVHARQFIQQDVRPLDLTLMQGSVDFGERFVALDTLQYIYRRPATLASLAGSRHEPTEHIVQRIREYYDVVLAMRSANVLVDQFLEAAESHSFHIAAEALKDASDTYYEYADAGGGEFRPLLGTDDRPVSRGNLAKGVVAMLLPAIGKVVRERWQVKVNEDLDSIALALGGYGAAHGEYPEQLTDLVPEFLDEIPLDRFNEQPLNYRVEGGAATVWSVGPDQQNDGGDEEADVVARMSRGLPR